MALTLALIPLDERPVNTRYPQQLGAIAGADILLPPVSIRGLQRLPADVTAVAAWLREASQTAQAVLVSTDFLGYGNLINARISDDSAAAVLARLVMLADINASCPVHAFAVITRVANANDCVEEPLYWAQWGTQFYRYSRLVHQSEQGAHLPGGERAELTRLEQSLPGELKADWLRRRLRNHTVNLGLMDMAGRSQIASLALTSDDTSPFGMPSRERDWLRGWRSLVGTSLAERVSMYPGADEVGSALTARLINRNEGRVPRVWIDYAVPGGADITAPYEDRQVRETVAGQVAACGCVPAASPEDSDFILGVVPPSPRRTDYRPAFLSEDRADRTGDYTFFLARLGAWQTQGRAVALADVAYPNGSDPLLMELLLSPECPLAPGKLAGYGAWNTAGNTLGVVVAQASCTLSIASDPDRALAQKIFLAHRFLEDYGYQLVVRREARAATESRYGHHEPVPDNPEAQADMCRFIAHRLQEILGALQTRGIGEGLSLRPHSVRLPWRRTFEVDFDLIPVE